jgi:hypothetical protein
MPTAVVRGVLILFYVQLVVDWFARSVVILVKQPAPLPVAAFVIHQTSPAESRYTNAMRRYRFVKRLLAITARSNWGSRVGL